MYNTVIKLDGHLRTRGKCRKHEPQPSVFYISWVFSNVRCGRKQFGKRSFSDNDGVFYPMQYPASAFLFIKQQWLNIIQLKFPLLRRHISFRSKFLLNATRESGSPFHLECSYSCSCSYSILSLIQYPTSLSRTQWPQSCVPFITTACI